MARIRSIHPGIYTDEAWASVSIAARWLGMGLCTEADDNGVFEWKPLQLKMRIFPADAVSVQELLADLVQAGVVMQFSAEGKALGALRNFCKFQRPRKPKSWFPTTADSRTFTAIGSEPVADPDGEPTPVPQKSELTLVEATPVPPKSEKSPQMEDGGWKREREEEDANASLSAKPDVRLVYPELFEESWRAYPHFDGRSSKKLSFGWWKKLPIDTRTKLPAACARFARESRGVKGEAGAKAMDRWLRDGLHEHWMPAEPQAHPPPGPRAVLPTDPNELAAMRARIMQESEEIARRAKA